MPPLYCQLYTFRIAVHDLASLWNRLHEHNDVALLQSGHPPPLLVAPTNLQSGHPPPLLVASTNLQS